MIPAPPFPIATNAAMRHGKEAPHARAQEAPCPANPRPAAAGRVPKPRRIVRRKAVHRRARQRRCGRTGRVGARLCLRRQDQPAIRVAQPADWQFRRLRIDSQLPDRSRNHHRASPLCSRSTIQRREGGKMPPADNSGHRNGTGISRDRRRSQWAVSLESAMSSRRTLGRGVLTAFRQESTLGR
jgi:hypothetical protein